MSSPTALEVGVDRAEYSRFEEDRKEVLVTITPTGTGLSGEQIQVQLRKARRARDEVVATITVTLIDDLATPVMVSFDLSAIRDEKDIPKVRRGAYFIHALSISNPAIEAESSDFKVSLISVDRLKGDYLHGTDQFSQDQSVVLEQPAVVTGITVERISLGHPRASFPLSFNYKVVSTPTVLGTTTATWALTDGQTLVLRVDGAAAQTATFNTADFVSIAAATYAEVAAVIAADIPSVQVTDGGAGALQISGGVSSLLVDGSSTAATTLGLLSQSSVPSVVRTLSWCKGPQVTLTSGKNTYTLLRGGRGDAQDYIQVRLSSIAALPLQSHAEELIIDRKPLDDIRIAAIVDQAISWVEDSALTVFLEPTRVVTEVDPDTVAYPVDSDIPAYVGATWDKVVDALHYTAPSAGHWIGFKCPYQPILCFETLYGKMSNVRIVDIALEWIEAHERTGWVELVPFNQEAAFNFIGLIWVQSLRGPVPLPNFWNFEAIVGFRDTPPVLIELVAKKAAMDVLTIAGQAFRGGFSSQSISRDGVSESVSYTASATFGIYSATIEDYRKWIDANLKELRGAFRGPNMVVL